MLDDELESVEYATVISFFADAVDHVDDAGG